MTSMMASTSPSVSTGVPALVVMVRMSASKTGQRRRFVGMNFEEVVGARHGQHRFDPLLDTRELQGAPRRAGLPVQVHQTADRRAVYVADGGEVDEDLLFPGGHERRDRGGEVRKDRIGQSRFRDVNHNNAVVARGRDIHSVPPREAMEPGGL